MLRLIYRQHTFDLLRTALTTTALASVVAVIHIFEGLDESLVAQSGDAVRDRWANVIVTQAEVSNVTAARSVFL